MRFDEFNNAFNTETRRILQGGETAVEPALARLREMLPELESSTDREVGEQLISRLPQYAVPPEGPSALMQEALEIERAAYHAPGTDAERIVIIAEARRKIFELADRAAADEAPGIRGLTRVLEHLEDNLRDPHWPLGGPQDAR
ncbi:MAG TPA: hypothetical protein VG497_28475 [Kribbella sp.]|nr:hypothetical protein [Kribbella sp.]